MGNFYYNPVNGARTGLVPMKQIDKKTFKNSIEDLYRYHGRLAAGAYYPVRILPSLSVDQDAEWPIVFHAGQIVSLLPIKDPAYYSAADTGTGILASGEVYTTIGVTGVAQKRSINLMYPEDIAGLLVPANGGTQTSYSYRADCGTNGIITMSGEAASTTSVPSTVTIPANRPFGLVNHQVYADLRGRYLNYEYNTQGVAVALDGVITVPVVMVTGAGTLTTVTDKLHAALDDIHQYVIISNATEATALAQLEEGKFFKPNAYGKFVTADPVGTAADIAQVFGKSLGARMRPQYNMDEVVDSFPGSGMKGTDTGGLKARLYDFATKVMGLTEVKGTTWATSKTNLKSAFKSPVATATTNVNVFLCTVDIQFGRVL